MAFKSFFGGGDSAKSRTGADRPAAPAGWISVEAYETAEALGCAGLAVPEMMAYSPLSFERVGYPVRVRIEAELLRYADHNFEIEVRQLYAPGAAFRPAAYRNSFTHDEKDLVDALRDSVAEMTERFLGKRVKPLTNLLVQVAPFRFVQAVARASGIAAPRVFEVGPGLGYFGGMLAARGFAYGSYDITQALCLWQNRLHGWLAAGDFGQSFTGSDAEAYARRVIQVPWWKYIHFRHGSPLKYDIVYSNSNLGEMTTVSLQHMLHISRSMLAESPLAMLCYMSPGSPAQNDEEFVVKQIEGFGFKRIMSRNFDAFVLADRDPAPALLALEQRDGLPAFDPSGRGGDIDANALLALDRREAPLDATICAFLHGWQPPFRD